MAELAARYRLPRRVLRLRQLRAARATCRRALPAPRPLDGPPRLVYQGTLSTNGGHYDLRDLFAAIAAQGLSLDVYPAREVPEYREIPGIRVHHTLPLAELLRELAGYDFGWAGFNAGLNGAHLDTALPNKLYEYLGCGLPVITLRHRALRRMLQRGRRGDRARRRVGARGRAGLGRRGRRCGSAWRSGAGATRWRPRSGGSAAARARDVVALGAGGRPADVSDRIGQRTVHRERLPASLPSRSSPARGCRPEVGHREPAVGPPRLGELCGPARIRAQRGEAVLDAQVGRQERVVVA